MYRWITTVGAMCCVGTMMLGCAGSPMEPIYIIQPTITSTDSAAWSNSPDDTTTATKLAARSDRRKRDATP